MYFRRKYEKGNVVLMERKPYSISEVRANYREYTERYDLLFPQTKIAGRDRYDFIFLGISGGKWIDGTDNKFVSGVRGTGAIKNGEIVGANARDNRRFVCEKRKSSV